MESKNVRELFSSLGKRLYLYESEAYLYDFFIYDPGGLEDKMDVPYEEMMYYIGGEVNRFDNKEVVEEVEWYINRIVSIHNKLKKREVDYVLNGMHLEKVKLSNDVQEKLLDGWKNELYFYLDELVKLKEVRELNVLSREKQEVLEKKNDHYENGKDVKVPSDIKPYSKEFSPRLDPKQVALFMHYLITSGVMPPYRKTAIGELSKFFFGRSKKTATFYELTPLKEIKAEENNLSLLKEIFAEIQNNIEIDLEEIKSKKTT